MNMQASLSPPEIGSLWQKTARPAPVNPPLSEDITVDVTVIGAGFTGLRAALHLAEAGSRVVVLDAGDVAYGASGRTGGQVNPMLPFNTPKQLNELLGDTYFERLTESALGSADELFSLIKTYQIECQARQNGWLRVCHNKRALQNATENAAAWNLHGAGMEILSREDIFRVSGSRAYASGIVTPKGGAVQPMSLAQGVADAARQRGVMIHGRSAVTDLAKGEEGWVATTAGGRVTSDWVIVATNGYTDSLIPGLAKSVLPLTPIQMATDPLPEDVIGSVLPGGHTISDSRRVIMYARREPDNRMVYGGFGNVTKEGQATGFDWLIKDANRVFPQLKGVDWTSRWWGRVALTDDHLPHLHEPKPGLLVGMGYNGRGVAMSHVMGRVLAERVLGAAPETLAFPTSPVRAYPYRSVTLAGIGTAVWLMRLLDFVESRGS